MRRLLRWAGHVARMPMDRTPVLTNMHKAGWNARRLLTGWVSNRRPVAPQMIILRPHAQQGARAQPHRHHLCGPIGVAACCAGPVDLASNQPKTTMSTYLSKLDNTHESFPPAYVGGEHHLKFFILFFLHCMYYYTKPHTTLASVAGTSVS
jgi:hypothetical protein